jgi:hypothetical protein
MSVTQSISPSTTSTAPPALNLKQLNLQDALKIIEFALKKHPDLADEVSSTIAASQIQARRRSFEKFYEDLVEDVTTALHPEFNERDEDDWDYDFRRQKWERELCEWGGVDHGVIEHSISAVVESVEEGSEDVKFHIAFKTLIEISQLLTSFQVNQDGVGWESLEDLSSTIDEVRTAMDEMALSWIKKDGKIDDGIYGHVLDLVRKEGYENEEDFTQDLEETISNERLEESDSESDDEDGFEEEDNDAEGDGWKGDTATDVNTLEANGQYEDAIRNDTAGNVIKVVTEETNQKQGAVKGGTTGDPYIIDDSVREDWCEAVATILEMDPQEALSKANQPRKRRRI